MIRTLIVILFCCVSVSSSPAQRTKLFFIDEANGRPVPFVTVLLKQKGEWLTADSIGVIDIVSDHASDLEILRVGYHRLNLTSKDYSQKKETVIVLKPLQSLLPPATIRPVTLEMILSKLRKRIKESTDTYVVANALYRQYHIENGKPVFMVEADAEVFFQSCTGKEELLSIKHVRRMPSTEQNPEQHSDHFVDLLFMNPVPHPEGSMLNKYVGENIRWNEVTYVEENETRHLLKLEYERLTEDKRFTETGKLVYDSLYRLISYAFTRYLNPGYGPDYNRYAGKYAWLKLEEKVECTYSWNDNLVLLNSIHQQYSHLLFHVIFHQADYELTEDFSWQSSGFNEGIPGDKNSFKLQSNLYAHGIRPDPGFFKEDYLKQFNPPDAEFVNLFDSPEVWIKLLNTP